MSEETTSSTPQDFSRQSTQIWLIGFGLMVGSAISLGLWYMTGSTHSHIFTCLLVAAVQASIQILVFMHLKNERGIIFKFLVFTMFFVMALFVLTHLHESDPLHDKTFSSSVK